MRKILTLVLITISQVAAAQNFMLTADGTPVQDNDTIVKTITGNGGWYTEVTDIEIENTSSQDLIINVHPNPASNSLTVISGPQFEVIEIYDVIGNLVLKDLLCAPGSCFLDISMLNEGIYFLKAHHGETTSVQRILINR